MSTIIAKAFDATKKIARTIFKGAPNLFTTADLNRQIEAFKYQMDMAQRHLPVIGNITINASSVAAAGNKQLCSLSVSHTGKIKVAGVSLSIPSLSWTQETAASGYPVYVVIKADKRELTFSDDPDHDIVGAKFTDNTAQAAANQVVYENPVFVPIEGGQSSLNDDDILGTVALVWFNKSGDNYSANVIGNWLMSPVPMLSELRTIRKNQYIGIAEIPDGTPMSEAIYTLQNRLAYEETQRGLAITAAILEEAGYRSDNDNTLAGLIGAETTSRVNGDNALRNYIDKRLPSLEVSGTVLAHSMVGGVADEEVGTWTAKIIDDNVDVDVDITEGQKVGTFITYQGGLRLVDFLDHFRYAGKFAPVLVAFDGTVGSRAIVTKDFDKDFIFKEQGSSVTPYNHFAVIVGTGFQITYAYAAEVTSTNVNAKAHLQFRFKMDSNSPDYPTSNT